jgi:hypothetical protein
MRPLFNALRIAVRDMFLSESGSGARMSLPSWWQVAHFLAKITPAFTGGGDGLREQLTSERKAAKTKTTQEQTHNRFPQLKRTRPPTEEAN